MKRNKQEDRGFKPLSETRITRIFEEKIKDLDKLTREMEGIEIFLKKIKTEPLNEEHKKHILRVLETLPGKIKRIEEIESAIKEFETFGRTVKKNIEKVKSLKVKVENLEERMEEILNLGKIENKTEDLKTKKTKDDNKGRTRTSHKDFI